MCFFFNACNAFEAWLALLALGALVLCVGAGIALVVRAWRSGSATVDVDRIVNQARQRAYDRGRDGF